jgi:hypothetical protein
MAPHKAYTIVTSNISRTKAEATEVSSSRPTFEFEFSFFMRDLFSKTKQHSIVMRQVKSSSESNSSIIGLCDLDLVQSGSKPIHICFGDPDSSPNDVVWESLICPGRFNAKAYELNIELENGARKVFGWKRTHDVEGVSLATKKADWLNFKMVESESGRVVARFVHHPWYGKKRGVFEIEEFEEAGKEWHRIVVLSGMAVVEYTRKVSGWSW